MFVELLGINLTLKKWQANPQLPRKEVSVFSVHTSGKKANMPFTEAEITRLKEELRKHAQTSYRGLSSVSENI